MDEQIHKVAKLFLSSLPHSQALGMEMVSVAPGMAEMRMPYRPEIVGDPETGVIHGGAVSALMDTCGGLAASTHSGSFTGTATLDLRIDYMRAATPGQAITARAECYHATRSVAFVRATAVDEDTDHPVATATGAFTVEAKK